jgi:uncharacterized protein YndB with AHSA1/START domain
MAEEDLTITVNRTIDAPRERVWQAWTEPDEVLKWWAPNGSTMTIEEMDVRPGGVFRFNLEMKNGYKMASLITFDEVTKPSQLAYTYDAGKDSGMQPVKSVFSFKDVDGKTEITMLLRWANAAEKEKHVTQYGAIEGAKQTLVRLGEYLGKA